jgi:hypothetical protein
MKKTGVSSPETERTKESQMPAKKYDVRLTAEERTEVEQLSRSNKHSIRERTRALILLAADSAQEGGAKRDQEIYESVRTSRPTVERVRARFASGGVREAISHKEQAQRKARLIDGEGEAHMIAMVCGAPPEGHHSWTLRLIADKYVEAGHIDAISHETVRQVLQKNELKPWLKKCWCLPPGNSSEFVSRMEDVLEVYTRPYDPHRPQVCLDEASKQLLGDVRDPVPMQPGQLARYDSEYERHGTANLFMCFEPLQARREVMVTTQRRKLDLAQVLKWLVDEGYPDAEVVVLVADNLNTHSDAALYEAFEPAEARRIAAKLEWHYTPKHGSWLNMAEIELSVLARQCLADRLPDQQTLRTHVTAWAAQRNLANRTVDWRFTTHDARIKLKRLYPSILP